MLLSLSLSFTLSDSLSSLLENSGIFYVSESLSFTISFTASANYSSVLNPIVFLFLMPCCTEKHKLSHIHDFANKRSFIDCNQRQHTLSLSLFEHKDKYGFIISQCKHNKL